MIKRRRETQAGFTLIEVLVAFVILGLAAGALISIFGSGSAKVLRAENERMAALGARSVLAMIGSEVPLQAGTREGLLPGGIRWTTDMQPYMAATPTDKDAPPPVTQPYLITVHAFFGSGATASQANLATLRLGSVAP